MKIDNQSFRKSISEVNFVEKLDGTQRRSVTVCDFDSKISSGSRVPARKPVVLPPKYLYGTEENPNGFKFSFTGYEI